MRAKLKFILFASILIIQSCHNGEQKEGEKYSEGKSNQNGQRIGIWKYQNKDTEFEINWETIKVNNIELIKEKSWVVVKDNYADVLLRPDSKSKEYLVFLSQSNQEFNLEEYVLIVLKKILDKDSLVSLHLQDVQFKVSNAYVLYHTKMEDDETLYKYASFFIEKEGYIYDMTLKVSECNFFKFHTLFEECIECLIARGKHLVSDKIIEISNIDAPYDTLLNRISRAGSDLQSVPY